MRNIIWIVVIVISLSLSAADCLRAQEQAGPFRTITVVSDDNYPPYIFRDSEGDIQGILVDQWRLWEGKTGIQVDLVGMDWARAQETIEQGRANVIDTMFFTERRAKIYDFSRPYTKIEVMIFFHENISGITDIRSVHGFSVGVKKGDACIELFRKNGIIKELVEYDSYEEIIQDAAKDNIRVFCIDKPPALYYLNKYNLMDEYLYTAPLYSGEFHRAVIKGRKDLLAEVEKGFSAISQDEYASIDRRWFGTSVLATLGFMRYLWLGLGLIGIALVLLLFFTLVLRRQVQTKTSDLVKTNLLLQESEKRFRTLAENSLDTIMRFDRQHRHLYVNPMVEIQTGIKPELFIGRTHRELGFPEDLCILCEDALGAVFETGEVQRIEFQLPSNVWIDWLVMPETGPKGEVTAVIASARDISERKLREEELKIFKESLENSTDAIGISTPRGRHYYQNKAFCEMFGDIGESPAETVYVDREIGDEVFQTIMSGGQWTGEVKMYSKNREVLDIYLRAYANKDVNGEITALVGIHTDITERKKAEEARHQSEKMFAATFMASPDSLVLARVSDGKIIEVNDTFLHTMGYSRHEVIGKTAKELGGWRHSDHRKKYVADLLQTGAVSGMETDFCTKDGKMISALISGRLIEIHGDLCSISIAHDISGLKRTEALIRESEEKYRTLVNNLNIGVYRSTADPHGRFIQVNPAMVKIFGYGSLEEFLSISVSDLYQDPEERKCFVEVIQRKGFVKDKQLAMRKKDGTPLWTSISANAQYDEDGDFIGAIETLEDISERIIAEEERARLQAQLSQAQKMEAIGTLAGGIAHDFNNILSAIIGYAELARMNLHKPEKMVNELGEVIKAGERARDLVKHILTFSRKTETRYSPLELSSTVDESLKMLRSVIPSTIEIRHDIMKSGLVMSNPTQIHQIIMNLCTNAAQAMDASGGVLEVILEKIFIDKAMSRDLDLTSGSYFKLTVSDTGQGIPPENMERIFDPYFTTKELGRGTGLGLSVVHGIVKDHHGAITCMSESGRGTTFEIYLPELESAKPGSETLEEEIIPRGTERIFFIDDEQVLVDMTERMLGDLGYEVFTETSSLKALEIFMRTPRQFDLVITDMTMPGMTGDKLAQKFMDIRSDIPVILCTGYSEHISEDRAKDIGIREFLVKPLEIKKLAAIIRKVLDQG